MGPLEGIRVVEVAQFIFVPSAGAMLADWGAEVIHVEHAEKGDPQRGFRKLLDNSLPQNVNPGMEHANRGKLAIGLALDKPEARDVLYRLVSSADVFLTNYLPPARRALGIDVDDIRSVRPDIVYGRGSNAGVRGPEAERGGFDLGTFWARGAGAAGVSPKALGRALFMPGPAYGDTISGTALAGGVAAALFKRSRTGEGSVVDVSLLGSAAWAMGMGVTLSLASGEPWTPMSIDELASPTNPLIGAYRTADDRFVQLVMNRPGPYWADLCEHIDRPDLATDERFVPVERLMENSHAAAEELAAEFRKAPLDTWVRRFQTFAGQWAVVQDSLELGHDEQLRVNGHISEVASPDGDSFELVTSPVQFDERPIELRRAPTFAEHTDELLRSLGFDDDGLIDLKLRGAVT